LPGVPEHCLATRGDAVPSSAIPVSLLTGAFAGWLAAARARVDLGFARENAGRIITLSPTAGAAISRRRGPPQRPLTTRQAATVPQPRVVVDQVVVVSALLASDTVHEESADGGMACPAFQFEW
jgi:hypothetical protein